MSRFALALAVLLLSASEALSQPTGRVRGTVTDESGGVLPGVTVTATLLSGEKAGRAITSTTTDAVGAYVLEGLPMVDVRLAFQLDGFAPATTDVTVSPKGDVRVLQRLMVAPREENVTVIAPAPAAPPPPEPPVIAPPPPPLAPAAVPVAEHDRESVCGPARLTPPLHSFGTIRSGPKARDNGLFFEGDALVVDTGTADGVAVGQNFAVRRTFKMAPNDKIATAEHTAGVVQIVLAGEHDAVGVVVYACDELMIGDQLAAFRPEPIRAPEPAGMPAWDDAAQILFADRGQLIGAPRRLMVINRGSDSGLHVAQRLTLFRKSRGANSVIGDAVVVAVRADSATIRVERATDIIAFGDFAAPQRYAGRGTR